MQVEYYINLRTHSCHNLVFSFCSTDNAYFVHKIENNIVKFVSSQINNSQFYFIDLMHFLTFHILKQQNALNKI